MKKQSILTFIREGGHVECSKQLNGRRFHPSWPSWEALEADLAALFELRHRGFSLPQFLEQIGPTGDTSTLANIGKKGIIEFEEFARKVFVPARSKAIKSWEWEEQRFEQFVKESAFMGRKLHTVTDDELKAWYNEYKHREGINSDNTRGNMLKAVRALFKYAVEDNYIRRDPSLVLKLPRVPDSTARAYTHGEVLRLYAAADPHLRPWILVTLYTGLRPPSEVNRLTVGMVDLEERRISVPSGGTRKKRARDFYIHGDLVPFMDVAAKAVPNLPLFRDSKGRPAKFPRPAFDRARIKANLPEMKMYELRHTFKTWLYQTGTRNQEMIDYLMGHVRRGIGAQYFHPTMEEIRQAIVPLPSITGAQARSELHKKLPNESTEALA